MSSLDYILIGFVLIYSIFFIIKMLSLRKVNNNYEILQKHKPKQTDYIDLLNNKLPLVITGEVEDWFIFNKDDTIDEEKLNNQTLNENTKNLCYIFPLVRKYNILNFNTGYESLIRTENNTKSFLVLLEGELSIKLYNPSQKDLVKQNNNVKTNTNLKFMELKLYAEQILHIPIQWNISYTCLKTCKILEVNSETILTLPYKMILDKK
jgi:hypothetical protein